MGLFEIWAQGIELEPKEEARSEAVLLGQWFSTFWASKHSLEVTAFTEARYPNQTNEELLCLKQELCP